MLANNVNNLMRSRLSSWSIPRGCLPTSSPICSPSSACAEEGVEGHPPSLGLRDSLRAVLIYMRHNVIQAVIGDQLGMSQSTISRAIGAVTDAIVRALRDVPLTAEEVPQGCDYVLDGTFSPAGVGAITANCGRANTRRPA